MKNSILTYLALIFVFQSCKKDEEKTGNNNNNPPVVGTCAGGATSVNDIDGNNYNIISIGNQCWMKENLNVSHYRNGNLIPTNLNESDWENTTSGAYTVYDGNNTGNDVTYGKLYNYYAVIDPRCLCPIGWRVPSDNDWKELIQYLDPAADTAVSFGINLSGGYQLSHNVAAPLIKSYGTLQNGTGLWEYWNASIIPGNDSSGFRGLPAGSRFGGFAGKGYTANWWSSTYYIQERATSIRLKSNDNDVMWSLIYRHVGYSVRCIKE